MKLLEKEYAHYEVEENPFGKIYVWHPDHFTLECDCGQTIHCSGREARCECGADCTEIVRRAVDSRPESEYRPWRPEWEQWYATSYRAPEDGL